MTTTPGTNFFQYNSPTVNVGLTNEFGHGYLVKVSATANIPTDGTAGYAPGAYLVDAVTGLHYGNIGTSASSKFVPVGGISSKTTTALGTTQNSTPTIAQLAGGIVTQTGATGAGTVTLPTGTLISANFPNVAVGYTFVTLFSNLGGAQTLTITGATGSTVLGTAAVGTGKNAELFFTNTGANTWNVYVVVSA